jgi:hypothetical protein
MFSTSRSYDEENTKILICVTLEKKLRK